MLHELLKVKQIREKSAHDEVQKRKYHLEETHRAVERAKQEFHEYVEWRGKEEQRLYDNIINMEVKQSDLDLLKQKVGLLREKDVLLEQAIAEAKKKVVDAEAALEEAREEHAKAIQAVKKFEEFTAALDEDAAKEAARLEDLEMEEFTVRPRH
ncbi:type III secretion system stalk subunit SctO [Endozoicomonas lisbonensis]|uniref:Chromosome segregation ATPase n=1 Tax=Endozoicomonas lisbonensis TaxID=3120522 RepID=A0ABV2SD47_9GAMM